MQYLFIYTMCIYLITQNIFQAHILTYSNYYVQISLKQYSLKMYFVAPQIQQERLHSILISALLWLLFTVEGRCQ